MTQIMFETFNTPAMYVAIQAFTHPGDKILIQTPAYYPIPSSIAINGRRVLENQLVFDKENNLYKIDFEDLEKKLKDPCLKMFIFVNPHNPVGKVWLPKEIEKIVNLCEREGVLMVSDEIWADHVFPGHQHIPMGKMNPNSITIMAPTKTFNLAGLNTSYVIIPNERLRRMFGTSLMRCGFFLPNQFAQIAMESAYETGWDWIQNLKLYHIDNINYVNRFCNENLKGLLKVVVPEATYLIWIDCERLKMTKQELDDFFLLKCKIWLSSGESYGNGGSGFARLNIACPKERVIVAMDRIEAALRKENILN
eukprot:TRINITY_DN3204_c0_g1_i3.p1 TRINITY_DN3204_c0_g1~~TRINITY_DN3204_c0_g1_i3.p1  ORF type:complete len:318 (+),score=95.48 TRINITY_DN3204_c0_g1_i3:28-954(+)